jgi:hypothetical protein
MVKTVADKVTYDYAMVMYPALRNVEHMTREQLETASVTGTALEPFWEVMADPSIDLQSSGDSIFGVMKALKIGQDVVDAMTCSCVNANGQVAMHHAAEVLWQTAEHSMPVAYD